MSNVCKLARPLIVRVISLQSPHPVTRAPIITVASILSPLLARSLEMGLERGISGSGTSL